MMPTITLSFNEAEQKAFQQLLDTALRNNGMGALTVVSHFFSLLNQAAQKAGAVQTQDNSSAAPVTQPTASQLQQPAQHGGGILEAIESALGFGHEGGQQQPASSATATPTA
jgi:hypothetical protein